MKRCSICVTLFLATRVRYDGVFFMGKERIRLVNVSKSYYSQETVTQALRKVNLTFSTGEFVAITGESGSGKSTLLHMIGGMDAFDEGEMFVDGAPTFQYDENDWEEYRCGKIGYVFQDYSLLGHYTVLDNIVGALLVMGRKKKEAEEIARRYLAQVGLAGLESHKAVELSSGQKQRLAIARALAKETGILLADEPTGNLDSETGAQIIELLAELSKERLVIMVTHNYDQVEPYVTRKIRIHDGEVISDTEIRKASSEVTEEIREPENHRREDRGTLWFFAKRNLSTQKGRTFMLGTFCLITAVVAFLLLGEIASHWDDTYTKKYSTATFAREDDKRIVVKKEDGSCLFEEDLESLRGLSYVEAVDSCDYANDVNYYFLRDEEYKLVYGRPSWNAEPEVVSIKFLDNSHFMQSVDCISESDLTAGRMPQDRREIVLVAEDEKYLDKSLDFYFASNNLWDSNYYTTKMKVVGIIKGEMSQAYFTTEFCHMITTGIWDDTYRLAYGWNYLQQDYDYKPVVYPVISGSLRGNTVRVAGKFPMNVIPAGEILFRTMDGDTILKEETVYVEEGSSNSTGLFLEVSQDFYDAHYTPQIKQASVYIVSYAKTDEVLSKPQDMGYYAVSTIRVGKTDYESGAVKERLTLIGVCAAGLLVLFLAQLLILRALLRSRLKDYDIMKFIGMKIGAIKKVGYIEMVCISIFCTFFTILGMNLLRLTGISLWKDMMWYYKFGTYVLFAIYVNISMLLTMVAFHASLKGRLQK